MRNGHKLPLKFLHLSALGVCDLLCVHVNLDLFHLEPCTQDVLARCWLCFQEYSSSGILRLLLKSNNNKDKENKEKDEGQMTDLGRRERGTRSMALLLIISSENSFYSLNTSSMSKVNLWTMKALVSYIRHHVQLRAESVEL